jgi:hypothetical protein
MIIETRKESMKLEKVIFATIIILIALVVAIHGQDKPIPAPAAKKMAEEQAIDELTSLKLQNGMLKIQKLNGDKQLIDAAIQQVQEQLQKDYDAYLQKNKLDPQEWNLDAQRMVLVKKKQPEPVKVPEAKPAEKQEEKKPGL